MTGFYAVLRRVFPRPVRNWLNGVALAVCGVLLAHGIIDGRQAAAWAALAGAMLLIHRAGLKG